MWDASVGANLGHISRFVCRFRAQAVVDRSSPDRPWACRMGKQQQRKTVRAT
jgi:hypothetical protein